MHGSRQRGCCQRRRDSLHGVGLNTFSCAGDGVSGTAAAIFRQTAPSSRRCPGVFRRVAAVRADVALKDAVAGTPVAGQRHRRDVSDRAGILGNWLWQRRLFAVGKPAATAERRNACDYAREWNVLCGAVRSDHGRHGWRIHSLHHGRLDPRGFIPNLPGGGFLEFADNSAGHGDRAQLCE